MNKSMFMVVLLVLIFSSFANANPKYSVVVLNKDEVAPYKGFLITEAQYIKLLDSQLTARSLKLELELKEQLCLRIENEYSTKLMQAIEPEKWYQKNSFHRVLGVVIGVAITTSIVYGVSAIR